jgi:ribonuclease BN (tRNA processing enzyme)
MMMMLWQARRKRHSTTEEALLLAERMGAYRVILTHFSARYPKVVPMSPIHSKCWVDHGNHRALFFASAAQSTRPVPGALCMDEAGLLIYL